jgi:hypothetical protein
LDLIDEYCVPPWWRWVVLKEIDGGGEEVVVVVGTVTPELVGVGLVQLPHRMALPITQPHRAADPGQRFVVCDVRQAAPFDH